MIYRMFRLFVLIMSLFSTTLYSQKIIAFDKHGKNKRVKYYKGDYFKFKTIQGFKHGGLIEEIRDSTFILNRQEFNTKAVKIVFNTQKNAGFKISYNVFIRGGIAYLPLVTFNRTINNDNPLIEESALIVTGSMLSFAYMSKFLANKPYRISEKRPLKIIDLSI